MGSEGTERELVELEEAFTDLTVSRPAPTPSSEPLPEPSPSASPVGSPSEVASEAAEEPVRDTCEPERFYAVWHVPRISSNSNQDFVGVHRSRGPLAYARILGLNNNRYEGIRFRRADSLAEAKVLFLSKAAAHGVDPGRAETIYTWA